MIQRTLHLYRRAYQGLSPSVWLLAGVMLINRCGTMVLPYMSLYLTQHLHYSVTDAGIVMAVYGSGAFVGTFIGGRLTDRYGFYYVQLLSLLFSGAALLTLQFITNFYLLCASVFLFTLLGDAFRPANQAAIAHYSEPETRTRAFSFNRLAINLGWAVGGGLGGWLASINYGLLFWTDGLTCLLAGIVLWVFLPVPVEVTNRTNTRVSTTSEPEISEMLSPYRDRIFIGFVLCNTLFLMAFFQFFTIVPLFFKQIIHLTERTIGLLMALNGVLIVTIEMALVYELEQRQVAKIPLIVRGALLTSFSFLILALPGWLTRFGVTFGNDLILTTFIPLGYVLFATFSEMLVMPFLQSLTVERSNQKTRGQYLALYSMSGALAQTTAPAFGSLMVAQVGFSAHWLAIAGISLLSAFGFWQFGKRFQNVIPLLKSERVNE
ncbi:MFS transporter [Spirosoma sp. BT702]|uniref:MFS transporter n=1 Tax=Spirosoma profusum TaxID=2771354 RepID=A0A927ATQ9_9BACT|nr:MFS transporter [Spirosoma profusum]MBD2700857.1 MFS transporter [Spirosoma profusum]